MADIIHFMPERAFTMAGSVRPGAGWTVEFFQHNTTTPVTVFQDEGETIPHPSPLPADANGVFPPVFKSNMLLKAVIKASTGTTAWTMDPCGRSSLSVSSASGITFDPIVGVPATNVQDAIETVYASILSVAADYGLGITNNIPLLADLDATNIPSGFYRYDTSTSGTFPSGVAAADEGIALLYRRNGSNAAMALVPASGSGVMFSRQMVSLAWGSWREHITVPAGAERGDIIRRGASAWERLAKGGAGSVLRMGADDPAWLSGRSVIGPIATTSGTAQGTTAIPAWATEIKVLLSGVSTNGSDHLLVQLGNSGGYLTTGYVGAGVAITSGNAGLSSSSGFIVGLGAAGRSGRGILNLTKRDDDTWVSSHVVDVEGFGASIGGGTVDVGGALDRLRLITSAGAAFDAGSFIVECRP